MNDTALNIKIPKELYDKLKKEAEKKNISLASLVRIICSEYFEKQREGALLVWKTLRTPKRQKELLSIKLYHR